MKSMVFAKDRLRLERPGHHFGSGAVDGGSAVGRFCGDGWAAQCGCTAVESHGGELPMDPRFVHPSLKCTNPTYPTYNPGYSLVSGMNHQVGKHFWDSLVMEIPRNRWMVYFIWNILKIRKSHG